MARYAMTHGTVCHDPWHGMPLNYIHLTKSTLTISIYLSGYDKKIFKILISLKWIDGQIDTDTNR